MRLILYDCLWFWHIPFGSMVKFQSTAQFLVDNLSYPVIFSLVLFRIIIIYIWIRVSFSQWDCGGYLTSV